MYSKIVKVRQKEYYSELFNIQNTCIKNIWMEVNKLCSHSKKSKNVTTIDKLLHNNRIITDKQEICNSMNNYFCDIGKTISESVTTTHANYKDYMPPPLTNSIFMETTTTFEIASIIQKLNVKKGPGPDGIHTRLLVDIAEEISTPLEHIFNMSILTGTIPTDLKIAKVIPVYKKGDKTESSNYRPISMLNILNKILEKIIYSRVHSFLDKYKILYKNQFGFRSNHSTSLALINVLDKVYEQIDKGNYALGVYLDIQKACDCINHDILLEKLKIYGIRGKAWEWFSNYLSNRKQFVSVNNHVSATRNISYGVPQGSVLGPLLFLIYINDVQRANDNAFLNLFADDTSLFVFDKKLDTLFQTCNTVIDSINKWFIANKLKLSIDKCVY